MALTSADRFVLGPLTTTFTQPSSCSLIYGSVLDDGELIATQAQSCGLYGTTTAYDPGPVIVQGLTHDDANCWPRVTVPTPWPETLMHWGFYSPGLSCPAAYYTACTAVLLEDGSQPPVTEGPNYSFQFALQPGETAVGCCPLYVSLTDVLSTRPKRAKTDLYYLSSGYTCVSSSILPGCATAAKSLVSLAQCELSTSAVKGSAASTTSVKTGIIYTTAGASVYAPMFQLNWKASDRFSLSTSTGSPPENTRRGLSTGEVVIIGIVPVAFLAAIGALVFFVLRRRKRRKGEPDPKYNKAELEVTEKGNQRVADPTELPTVDECHEASTNERQELPASFPVYELNGTR
ncbi:MAG: hypothetical protein M1820_001652 [Bogoriella megaspora]|nr:MAG: hypothetical protein M1820_001652 [Bogoriella megaspora]